LALTSLTGCNSIKPISVLSKPVEKTPLGLEDPDPLKAKKVEWIVVTPENVDEVFAKLQEKGHNVVLFAVTEDGYQQLAITMADLRNFINTQRNIIIKYKEYYETKDEKKK